MKVERFLPRSWLALAALVLAFAFLGASVTYFVTERTDGGPGPNSVDVGFLQDMVTHHEQALALSLSEIDNGDESGVKLFAKEILQQQSYEIGLMQRQLSNWGYARENRPETAMEWMGMEFEPQQMPGMASDAELRALREASGREADALFIALMQDHHRGGVDMAAAAAEEAESSWVRDLAARFVRNQAIEINEMEAARERFGLSATPDGFNPGPFPDMSAMEDMEDMDHGGDESDG